MLSLNKLRTALVERDILARTHFARRQQTPNSCPHPDVHLESAMLYHPQLTNIAPMGSSRTKTGDCDKQVQARFPIDILMILVLFLYTFKTSFLDVSAYLGWEKREI